MGLASKVIPVLWRLPAKHEQRVFVLTAGGLPITKVILRSSVSTIFPSLKCFVSMRRTSQDGIGPLSRRLRLFFRPKFLRLHCAEWVRMSACQCVYMITILIFFIPCPASCLNSLSDYIICGPSFFMIGLLLSLQVDLSVNHSTEEPSICFLWTVKCSLDSFIGYFCN